MNKIAVKCENHTKPINTLCGQNIDGFDVKTDGIYGPSYNGAFKK
jgi:hypothetical protein